MLSRRAGARVRSLIPRIPPYFQSQNTTVAGHHQSVLCSTLWLVAPGRRQHSGSQIPCFAVQVFGQVNTEFKVKFHGGGERARTPDSTLCGSQHNNAEARYRRGSAQLFHWHALVLDRAANYIAPQESSFTFDTRRFWRRI